MNNRHSACRRDPRGYWEAFNYLETDHPLINLAGEEKKFWGDFSRALEAMTDRSEIRAFKIAYDKLGDRADHSRSLDVRYIGVLSILVKTKGADCGINVANSGRISAWLSDASGHQLLTRWKFPAGLRQPNCCWEPLPERPVDLIVCGSETNDRRSAEEIVGLLPVFNVNDKCGEGMKDSFFRVTRVFTDPGELDLK